MAMAARFRAPAITPDARHHDGAAAAVPRAPSTSASHRAVSFGFGSLKTPKAGTAAAPGALAANEDVGDSERSESTMRQYSLYRSAADQFPSYERLRFVRLPQNWLPAALRDGGIGPRHWPALVYQNLAELVRDLSPAESKFVKAKLILEHRKYPATVVARLLGWKTSLSKGCRGVFEETKLELIRLSGASLEENEDPANGYEELTSFVDGQVELESICNDLLASHASAIKDGAADAASAEVLKHTLQFQKAVDMALNCLAVDVGAEPLPTRNEDELAWKSPTKCAAATGRNMPDEQGKRMFSVKKPKINANKASLGKIAQDNPKVRVHKCGEQAKRSNEKKQSNVNKGGEAKKSNAVWNVAAGEKENQSANTNAQHNSNKRANSSNPIKGLTARSPKRPKLSPKRFQAKSNKKEKSGPESSRLTSRPAKPTSKSTSNAPLFAFDRQSQASRKMARPASMPAKPDSKSISNALTFTFDRQPHAQRKKIAHSSNDDEEVSWKDVWNAMKRAGWTWKGGSGLMMDYFYIKPGAKFGTGVKDQDYFCSEKDTQAYARNVYGWGEVSHDALMGAIQEHAKFAGESVPRFKEGSSIEPNEPWKEVWEKMLQSGWMWKAGSGLMMDYYYIKPGCGIKGGLEGRDYFTRKDDVKKFAMRNYGWIGEKAICIGDDDARPRRRRSAGRSNDECELPEKRQKIETVRNAVKRKIATSKAEKRQLQVDHKPAKDNDSDDESISDNRSTYSQSGFHSKTLFLEECADSNVPSLKIPIDPSEPWRDAWQKMLDSGWMWKIGSGLMTDYYYIKPGCKVKGGVKGQDYFDSVNDVQRFATRNYGWIGEGKVNSDAKKRRHNSSESNTIRQTKRKKGAENTKQSQSHKLSKGSQETISSFDWATLQRSGWRAIKAGRYNQLHDWYYIRPNCDPGDASSQLGVDYFLCEEDAIKSANHYDATKTAELKVSSKLGSNAAPAVGGLLTPDGCHTKPRDPAVPLPSSPGCSSSLSPSNNYYEWKNLWPILQRAGWTYIKAGRYNPLHDWYFVRPNRHPGDGESRLGRHYFNCEEDVIEFIQHVDKETDKRSGKKPSIGTMLGAFEEEANKAD